MNKYRPEIDGLRAIAVISVMLNHFNHSILPNGYLGVDIFFVISGFVITSSLDKKNDQHLWDFLSGFYSRRIKRLIPALAFFVLITSSLICLFNPLPSLSIRTGILSLFGLSNLYLYFESFDYFGLNSTLNPFTNTWSLGIEEQFYLIFPILIFFTGFGRKNKGSKNLFSLVSIVSFLSIISYLVTFSSDQSAAYFLPNNRFWEIGFGCLTYLLLDKKNYLTDKFEHINQIFLLIIVFIIMLIPNLLGSVATILTVLLTSIFIYLFKYKTWTYNLFTNNYLLLIGKRSYSLYLWHGGILCLSRWSIGIHWWTIPFQIGLILLLSNFSYSFIEQPFRKNKLSKSINFLIGGGIVFLSSIYQYFILYRNFPFNLYIGPKISLIKDAQPKDNELVLESNTSKRNVFIFGDSQSGIVWFFMKNLLKIKDFSVYAHPRLRGLDNNFTKQTETQNQFYFLKFSLNHYKNFMKKGDVIAISLNSPRRLLFPTKEGITEIIDYAKDKQIKVILVGQVPIYPTSSYVNCSKTWYRPNFAINKNCFAVMSYQESRSIMKPLNDFYLDLQKNNKDVFFFDPSKPLCNENICFTKKQEKFLYVDGTHLSEEGAKLVFEDFKKFFIENIF